MTRKKSSPGPIWAVVIAGALLLVVVQFLPFLYRYGTFHCSGYQLYGS